MYMGCSKQQTIVAISGRERAGSIFSEETTSTRSGVSCLAVLKVHLSTEEVYDDESQLVYYLADNVLLRFLRSPAPRPHRRLLLPEASRSLLPLRFSPFPPPLSSRRLPLLPLSRCLPPLLLRSSLSKRLRPCLLFKLSTASQMERITSRRLCTETER